LLYLDNTPPYSQRAASDDHLGFPLPRLTPLMRSSSSASRGIYGVIRVRLLAASRAVAFLGYS
ncbi:MAG TPA: hypothetical protein VGG64_03355, partial [Pirellulales bacterium]